jgi:YggT family protein
MGWLSVVLQFGANVIFVYTILLFLRLLSGWFSMDERHQALRLLGKICDPYLGWFRRFRWMSIGRFDFSPIVALLLMSFLQNLLQILGQTQQFSFGLILAVLIQLVWGAVQFILIFFLVFIVIRYLALRFRWEGQTIWNALDAFLLPVTGAISKILKRRGFVPYQTSLLVSAVLFALLLVAGSLTMGWAVDAAAKLPL